MDFTPLEDVMPPESEVVDDPYQSKELGLQEVNIDDLQKSS